MSIDFGVFTRSSVNSCKYYILKSDEYFDKSWTHNLVISPFERPALASEDFWFLWTNLCYEIACAFSSSMIYRKKFAACGCLNGEGEEYQYFNRCQNTNEKKRLNYADAAGNEPRSMDQNVRWSTVDFANILINYLSEKKPVQFKNEEQARDLAIVHADIFQRITNDTSYITHGLDRRFAYLGEPYDICVFYVDKGNAREYMGCICLGILDHVLHFVSIQKTQTNPCPFDFAPTVFDTIEAIARQKGIRVIGVAKTPLGPIGQILDSKGFNSKGMLYL